MLIYTVSSHLSCDIGWLWISSTLSTSLERRTVRARALAGDVTPSSRQTSVQPGSGCHRGPSVPRCLFGSNAVDGPVDLALSRRSPPRTRSSRSSLIHIIHLQIGTVCLGCAGTVDWIWWPLYGLRLPAGTRNLDSLLFHGRSRLRLLFLEHFEVLSPPPHHLLHFPRLDPRNGQQQRQLEPNSEF